MQYPTNDSTKNTDPSCLIELTGPLRECCLVPLTGDRPRRLGRRGDSDGSAATFHDPHLAKIHALLIPVANKWFLSPEPSLNGVYVRIDDPRMLQPGDEFIMGGTHGRVINAADIANEQHIEASSDQDTTSIDSPTPLVLEAKRVEK